MKISTKTITPELALKMLERNTKNRSANLSTVKRYSNDMANGRWRSDTGEAIKISESGVLLDGQHRLMALVESEVPIEFLVITGIKDDRFDVIDTGKPRTAKDIFSIQGVPYSASISSIIAKCDLIKKHKTDASGKHNRLTNRELLEEYYSREVFWKNVMIDTNGFYEGMSRVLSKSLIGSFYATFLDSNSSEAISFMTELSSGNDVTNSTINVLRRILIQDKISLRKMTPREKDAIIIKTWNCYVEGKELKRLFYNAKFESFPKIK